MAHTCGVTTIPEIRLYKIQQYDRWVCIATDGVWDVLSLSDVGDIINSIASRSLKWNPKQAAGLSLLLQEESGEHHLKQMDVLMISQQW